MKFITAKQAREQAKDTQVEKAMLRLKNVEYYVSHINEEINKAAEQVESAVYVYYPEELTDEEIEALYWLLELKGFKSVYVGGQLCIKW